MQRHDNDDKLPFISLAALTANVLQHLGLNEQKKEECKDKKDAGKTADDYIKKRVSELDAFERRPAGLIPHRSRRQRE